MSKSDFAVRQWLSEGSRPKVARFYWHQKCPLHTYTVPSSSRINRTVATPTPTLSRAVMCAVKKRGWVVCKPYYIRAILLSDAGNSIYHHFYSRESSQLYAVLQFGRSPFLIISATLRFRLRPQQKTASSTRIERTCIWCTRDLCRSRTTLFWHSTRLSRLSLITHHV